MFKTTMLVSALALSTGAMAQDQTQPTNDQVTTLPAKQDAKAMKKAKKAPDTATTPTDATAAPTTAAQGAPITGAPVSEAMPAEQAAAPAPQTVPATPPVAPAETATATATPATPADPATPATPTEVAATPATPATPATLANPKAAVTGATQIAQVVNTEFPTYDKNSDTNLDRTEFAAWMVALKSASDPSTKAGDPATVKWIDGAFASADTDKSKMVSKDELTKYLSQGAD